MCWDFVAEHDWNENTEENTRETDLEIIISVLETKHLRNPLIEPDNNNKQLIIKMSALGGNPDPVHYLYKQQRSLGIMCTAISGDVYGTCFMVWILY